MSATPTPLRRVRLRCLDCAQGQAAVRRCEHTDCPLYHLRMGRGSKGTGGVMRPVRAYCLWCAGDSAREVRECPSTGCPLWPLRLGRRVAADGPALRGKPPKTRGVSGRSPLPRVTGAPRRRAPGERPVQAGFSAEGVTQ